MRRRKWLATVVAPAAPALAVGRGGDSGTPATSTAPTPGASKTITVTSPAFVSGGSVPPRFPRGVAADRRLASREDVTTDVMRRTLAGHTVASGTLAGRCGRTR